MITTVSREVEETGLLSESDRMLSKTILVPGANHAQVNTLSSISVTTLTSEEAETWCPQDQFSGSIFRINP